MSLGLSLLPPSFTYRDPFDDNAPPRKTQDNLPIQSQLISSLNSILKLNSLLPCNIAYSQVQGETWASFGGGHYLAYHSISAWEISVALGASCATV